MDSVTLTLAARDGRLIVCGPRSAEALVKNLLSRKAELLRLLSQNSSAAPSPASQEAPAGRSLTADETDVFAERLAIVTVCGRLSEEEAIRVAWDEIHRRRSAAGPGVAACKADQFDSS